MLTTSLPLLDDGPYSAAHTRPLERPIRRPSMPRVPQVGAFTLQQDDDGEAEELRDVYDVLYKHRQVTGFELLTPSTAFTSPSHAF